MPKKLVQFFGLWTIFEVLFSPILKIYEKIHKFTKNFSKVLVRPIEQNSFSLKLQGGYPRVF